MKEEQLIFIISQPRSGSTYLQNLLSNNTEVNTCSEPWVLLHFANQIKPELVSAAFNNNLTDKAFQDYLSKYPEIQINTTIKNLMLELYSPMAKGFSFVIDKTPRYWELLDKMIELFPKSKFIILKRNPIHVATSIIKTWGIKDIFELNEFKRDLLLAPKQIHSFCEKNSRNKNVYTLRYEDLTANVTGEVKKLYDWIGISFSEQVINTENNQKYKGKYGDPYQNAVVQSDVLRKNARKKELDPAFKEFIIGYKNYLTPEFLSVYGGYLISECRPNKTFKDFIAINDNVKALNKQLYQLKHSTTYKVGRYVMAPFQFIKKCFINLSDSAKTNC